MSLLNIRNCDVSRKKCLIWNFQQSNENMFISLLVIRLSEKFAFLIIYLLILFLFLQWGLFSYLFVALIDICLFILASFLSKKINLYTRCGIKEFRYRMCIPN